MAALSGLEFFSIVDVDGNMCLELRSHFYCHVSAIIECGISIFFAFLFFTYAKSVFTPNCAAKNEAFLVEMAGRGLR